MNIFESIEQYKNGKFLYKLMPVSDYLENLAQRTSFQKMPKHMVNRDKHRRNNPQETFRMAFDKYFNFKTVLLWREQDIQIPGNLVKLWGYTFNCLYKLFSENMETAHYYSDTLSNTKFKQMPERYLGAFRKPSRLDNFYGVQTTNPKSDCFMYTNQRDTVLTLLQEASEIIPLIYKPEQTDSNTLIKPDKDASRFITNEQLNTVIMLQSIFSRIAALCIPVAIKNSGKEIIKEYQNAKKRKEVIYKAQKYVRTVDQVLVSMRKNNVLFNDAEMFYAAQDYDFKRKVILSKLSLMLKTPFTK